MLLQSAFHHPHCQIPQAELVRMIVDEAKASIYRDLIERRSKMRYPFFVPATLLLDQGPERPIALFTRDVSRAGIGLLHGIDLPLERGLLTIVRDGIEMALTIQIMWCRPSNGGWFLSGAAFVNNGEPNPSDPPVDRLALPSAHATGACAVSS